MLTIAPGVDGSEHYFSKDNYYTKEEGIENSFWYGKGATLLGLEVGTAIDPDAYQALWRGEVEGRRLGRIIKGETVHRPGWDLTFSAPKSLSILSEVYGVDELRVIHERAVRKALSSVEAMIDTRTRVGDKTRLLNSGNGVFACFTHDTNRNLDCQLHTHGFMLNMTQTEAGWRSIQEQRIFKSQKQHQFGIEYRSALAVYLKEAGYRLRNHRDPRFFEIDGVPEELIRDFSTRSQDIERWFEDRGLDYDPAIAKAVALITRKSKKSMDRETLRAVWRELAQGHTVDLHALKHSQPSDPGERDRPADEVLDLRSGQLAKKAVQQAVRHLSEREMGFTEEELKKAALTFALGGVFASDIDLEIQSKIRHRQLLRSKDHPDEHRRDKGPFWTTPEQKRLEERLIEQVHEAQRFNKHFVKADTVAKALAKSILNAQQRQAILAAATSKDRMFCIQGDPGVGKTTALQMYRKIVTKAGYDVIGLAPTYRAVSELSSSLNIPGMTVDRFLVDPTTKDLGKPFRQQVWVVDEASMLSSQRMNDLIELAEQRKARILWSGDHQQLESVSGGRGFYQIQRAGISMASLNQWVRPKTEYMKSLFGQVMRGEYQEAIHTVADQGHLVSRSSEEDLLDRVAEEWAGLSKKERDGTIVVTPTNEQARHVNEAIRDLLKAENKISKNEVEKAVFRDKHMTKEEVRFAGAYGRGDVVRFSDEHLAINKDRKAFIGRHEYFDVIGVNREENTIAIRSRKDNRIVVIDPAKTGGHREGGVQVFTQEKGRFSKGDQVRWVDNKNDFGLKRNDELVVDRVDKNGIHFVREDGSRLELDTREFKNQHFVHAYAKTAYGVQGATRMNVMAVMTSWRINTTNARSFMVALTRATHSARVYTDDSQKLTNSMNKRSGSNTEALTDREFEHQVELQRDRSETRDRPLL